MISAHSTYPSAACCRRPFDIGYAANAHRFSSGDRLPTFVLALAWLTPSPIFRFAMIGLKMNAPLCDTKTRSDHYS